MTKRSTSEKLNPYPQDMDLEAVKEEVESIIQGTDVYGKRVYVRPPTIPPAGGPQWKSRRNRCSLCKNLIELNEPEFDLREYGPGFGDTKGYFHSTCFIKALKGIVREMLTSAQDLFDVTNKFEALVASGRLWCRTKAAVAFEEERG